MTSRTYGQLIRENRDFRQLWIAAVISMLGEWFNTIALFFLILEYTGSEFLLGMLFTVRMAGFAILQPFIGLLADRYNRKMLMVVSNLLQAVFALCFLLVNDSSDIVWMIGLSGLMMVLHGVYMTAERAALPNVVAEEDLATANALDAASWSTALCMGAMLGGVVVSIWGTNAAFIIDSVTFLVGTLFLINLTIPQTIDESMKGPWLSTGIRNIKSGWARIRSQPALFRIVFAKASWNVAGGGLAGVYLVLMGANVQGFGAAFGFGLFFFARGVGTGLGPILARAFLKDEEAWPRLVGYLIVLSGLIYFLVGLSVPHALWITVVLVILAHSASGANWVLSTVMMQQWVEDEVRGRVFSTDMLILSIAFSTSTSVAGYLMENTDLGIQNGIMLFASVMVFCGIVFSMWQPGNPSSQTAHSA
ncbi:MAG: MFS transporter [Candidatus Thermoplasmatota archaeon]|nr:MFS transporter [Candidatus Thermoplasmatota archaeon]MEC9194718.1 MFS transporter [Candidatus Thermoplasmatota archaeon]MED5567272.1 MFS transporter [Candidatus Thermoplasmatota archaeon]MEE3084052.1 MFS transporter [Candidatus Thermoplasmatota archaeon]GIR76317.1 MAG: MFS transporter [Candidatus Poseidoniales archaeon]